MGARNEKKLCQPKDITLKNTSAENEVDPKSFLGLDRFLVNVHTPFWEIFWIITRKYMKSKDFM